MTEPCGYWDSCDCCAWRLDSDDLVLCAYCVKHCLDDEDRAPISLDEEVSA